MKNVLIAATSLSLLLGIGLPMAGFQAGDAKKGQAAFDNCAICHNADSTEAKVGPGLKGIYKRKALVNGKPVTDDNIRSIITDGSGGMPGFGDSISKEDKNNLIAYLKTL